MITTPTLFVLGAGASKPYGLPLGSELRRLICNAESEQQATNAIVQDGQFTKVDIKDFARTFLRSNVASIDAFLGRYSHLVEVGKALIAAFICSKENPAAIFAESNPADLEEDHWYQLLWNELIDGTQHGHNLRQNNVRFITFNYDRSLEFFLHESTKNTYGLNDAAAYEHWSFLKVMHVYGSVGEFKGTNASRPYSPKVHPRELSTSAANIHIIPEDRDNDEVFQTARKWFDWAKHVYVLGFGFDRLNCQRLGFSSVLQFNRDNEKKPAPSINASIFGLTPAEVARAQQHLLGTNEKNIWKTHHAMNKMTLRMAGLPD